MTAHSNARMIQSLLGIALFAGLLFGVSACGTFTGMSWEERDQANKDLAKESSYSFKPERSLQDNHEVPGFRP
jgi:hypothetical protein